ncbi:MAG: PAC2 family protein [Nanoarchaeota archaeon]
MEIILEKKPKNPIIIEGFPGFGFVSTIATEFLIEHLNAKLIGRIESSHIMPMVAMHNSRLVEPLGIFYDSNHNIMIFHAITNVAGMEWELAEKLAILAKELKAKEVISLEGVASNSTETKAFFYTTINKSAELFKRIKVEQLKEGIVMGVTGALLLKSDCPTSAIFVETHSQLPDSRAAAKIIEVLDKYLNLKVDYKPLLEKAEAFEEKLKTMVQQKSEAEEQKEKKELSYFG